MPKIVAVGNPELQSAIQWFYVSDDGELGPVSSDVLKELVSVGEIQPDTLIWREGMPQWKAAATLKALFPTDQIQPRPPTVREPSYSPHEEPTNSPITSSKGAPNQIALWAYRGVLVFILITVFCPWIEATSSASLRYGDLGRDMGRYGRDLQGIGNQHSSFAVSIRGLNTSWGMGMLLLVAVGIALSFVAPSTLRPIHGKLLLVTCGAIGIAFVVAVSVTMNSYVNSNYNIDSRYASSSANVELVFGWYLALAGSVAGVVTGFTVNWPTPAGRRGGTERKSRGTGKSASPRPSQRGVDLSFLDQ